jgi:hypothetical protein
VPLDRSLPATLAPLALALLATISLCAPAHAQTAPTPAAATSSPPTTAAGEAPVALSPFEVRPEDDSGYQAANTTSGSRLNAKLKDTPAAGP